MNRLILLIMSLNLCVNALAQEGTLVVANRVGGSISMIDLETKVEIARIPVGERIPHEIDVSPDGRWALTSEYGPNNNRGQHLILIDIINARIVGRIDLGPDSRPHTALFLNDNRHAVATMQDSDKLALVDTFTLKVLRTYPTGGREGHMVRLSPDNARAYVTSRGGEGTLSVIYLKEDKQATVIVTGAGAEGLAVSPDGSEVWVANRREESISIVNAETLEVDAKIDARPFAGRLEIGPQGRVAMPNGTSSELVPQIARLYDQSSRKVLREAPIRDGQPDRGNFGILIHDGSLFVSDPGDGTIQIFDMDTMDDPQSLAIGHEGPDGMDWSPYRVLPLK